MNFIAKSRLFFFFVGLVLLFIGQRYFSTEALGTYFSAAAGLLLVVAVFFTFLKAWEAGKRSLAAERKGWLYACAWQLGVVVSLGLYAWYQVVMNQVATDAQVTTALQKILLGSWLIGLTLSSFAAVGIEWALYHNGRGQYADDRRVCRCGITWSLIGLVLVFLVSVNYLGVKKNLSADLSYLKVTSPSEATLKLVSGLKEPLKINLFFPAQNEVLLKVNDYFVMLQKSNSAVELAQYDKDLDPNMAEKLAVTRNGQVVFQYGEKKSRIDIGLKLENARNTIKKLDSEVQRRLYDITQGKKTIYFARGHGEKTWVGEQTDGGDGTASLRILEKLLRLQNFSLKFWSLTDGSSSGVPEDADLLVIAGPTENFQAGEVAAMEQYLERGGSILVALDPLLMRADSGVPVLQEPSLLGLHAMLEKAGLKFQALPLANDRAHVVIRNAPSETWFLVTNVFAVHESVSSLSRDDQKSALLTNITGHIEVDPKKTSWLPSETVRTLSDTFVDKNRNFKFDKDSEQRSSYIAAAVSSKVLNDDKVARIALLGSSSIMTDMMLENSRSNLVFVADTVKWLTDQGQLIGAQSSEEDVRIIHTKKENAVWFNATVFVVPFFMLGLGFLGTRRRRSPGSPDESSDAKLTASN